MANAKKSSAGDKTADLSSLAGFGFGGLLEGVGKLLEAAGKLKESGVINQSGEFNVPGLGDKGTSKGVFGFSIRSMGEGPDGQPGGVRIRPFGNVRKKGEGLSVEEAREPVVDVFEEPDCVRVIAELPGVSAEAIRHEVNGDILTIRTEGDRCYSAEVLLPAAVKKESGVATYNNGIFELRLAKG
jgi:HSP20 family protein